MHTDKIFVQMAAYRDPELLPTLRDCIQKASKPENLVFSIAWQHAENDSWDNLDEFLQDDRFKIIDIPYQKSKGVCWARNKLQQQYNGEHYTLQLDSHHQFLQNWDAELIFMFQQVQSKGYKKPVLTGYLPFYDPITRRRGDANKPLTMVPEEFTAEGITRFTYHFVPSPTVATEPIPAKFYSAHFCFTLGTFCSEVPHDPNYYFYGEELSIAVRAYTQGYDLFHPHKNLIYHLYSRKARRKHWQDDPDWRRLDQESQRRNRILLEMETGAVDFGKYGLGSIRSLQDYERYSGLNFKKRTYQLVQPVSG